MKRLALLVAVLACAQLACAQQRAPEACPHPGEVTQVHLLGSWRAEFQDGGPGATLLLERHADYAESVRGSVNRNGELRPVAGDVEGGDFTLEESADGVHIAAAWIGEVTEGSCGQEIRGTWKAEGATLVREFVLRKVWQAN